MTDTYDRAAMRAELVRDEGERLRAYRDTVGKWTIGVGHNLDDVGTAPLGRSVEEVKANGITADEAALMLEHDLERVDTDLDGHLPWWRKLDPVRQRVLVNMCFNMGIGSLCGFRNTLRMVEVGNYTGAATGMLTSLWARQVGARATRLADMMKTGAA
jgi:lysozyme